MKKTIVVLAFMLFVVFSMTGCYSKQESEKKTSVEEEVSKQNKEKIVVGVVQIGSESDWRAANTQSFKDTFTAENGYYMLFEDGQQKQENQLKAIRNYIMMEVDYIVLAPIVETGWDDVLREAKDAEIPVILVDRMVKVEDESLYTCWIGADFQREGEDAAAWLADYLEEKGRSQEAINIVTLQGTVGGTAQIGRTEGFAKKMQAHPNWNMLDKQEGDFTQAKGREVMETFLKKYPNIDVVVSENDNMTFGVIEAIEAAGKTCGPNGDIIIISFDAVHAAFEEMIAGKLNVTIECNPLHGPKTAETIQQIENGETPEKTIYMEEGIFPAETAKEMIKGRPY